MQIRRANIAGASYFNTARRVELRVMRFFRTGLAQSNRRNRRLGDNIRRLNSFVCRAHPDASVAFGRGVFGSASLVMIATSPTTWPLFTSIPINAVMRSQRLIGGIQPFTGLSDAAWLMRIGRLPLAMANMVRVDVGLDDASPTYVLDDGSHAPKTASASFSPIVLACSITSGGTHCGNGTVRLA